MCEIIERNRAEAYAEGESRGAILTLTKLVRKNMISLEEAAESANMSVAAFKAKMEAYS